MQKRPNPTFLKKAEGIRNSRTKRTLIIILCALFVTLVIVFVTSVAAMQERYRNTYPGLVGAATAVTTSWSEYTRPVHTEETEQTTEATTTTQTEVTTTALAPVIAVTTTSSETTSQVTDAAPQNNAPDIYSDTENVHFRESYPSRTCSYQEREIALDQLKGQIDQFQTDHPEMRICCNIVCLKTREQTGVNVLDPILPSGAWSIPIGILLSEGVENEKYDLSQITTFENSGNAGSSSYIAQTYAPGKQFYTRMLLHYALSQNDSLALSYINNILGSTDVVASSVAEISGYSSYINKYIYTDYRDLEISSTATSTCYDMTNYLKYLYNGFINDPSCYQNMLNDMANSQTSSPIAEAFEGKADVYHVLGRNTSMGAYMDCAIVDGDEPLLLVIYCEAATPESAGSAIYTIAGYTEDFVASCYSQD